ncbi:flavin-dependent dehydrogenase [Rhizobium sp. SG570]|nr:flavin-dependent dehydrogenase [Rhizobium sp. SG570]
MNDVNVDCLVIGAGVAGCSAALALCAQHSVVIIDRLAEPVPRIGETLPASAERMIRRLTLWDEFLSDNHTRTLGSISCWGSSRPTIRDGFLDPSGLGWSLDRIRFERMFRKAATRRGVRIIAPGQVVNLDRNPLEWIAQIQSADGPQSIAARFVILANGRRGFPPVRRAGVDQIAHDKLVCRYVRVPRGVPAPYSAFTVTEAVEEGWWYAGATADGRRILAYHTDADMPTARRACSRSGFLEMLKETYLLASCASDQVPDVARASARSQSSVNSYGLGWCAVGDATCAFDPLSSQGLFHALFTGISAGEALADASRRDDTAALANYENTIRGIVTTYRSNLTACYALEKRFYRNEFWARRQSSKTSWRSGNGAMKGALGNAALLSSSGLRATPASSETAPGAFN